MGRVIIIVRNDIQTFGLHIHNRDIQIIGTIKIGIFELRRQYLELCLVDQIFRKGRIWSETTLYVSVGTEVSNDPLTIAQMLTGFWYLVMKFLEVGNGVGSSLQLYNPPHSKPRYMNSRSFIVV